MFSYTCISQTKCACRSPGDLVGLMWSLRFYISYRSPGDAAAADLGSTPWLARSQRTTKPLSHPNNPYSNFPTCLNIFFIKMLWTRIQSRMIHYILFSPLFSLLLPAAIPWVFISHGTNIFKTPSKLSWGMSHNLNFSDFLHVFSWIDAG